MATKRYSGNAPTVQKVITVNQPGTTGTVYLGPVGGPYISIATWDASAMSTLWSAMLHPFFQEITPSFSGTDLILTHQTPGEDFHVEALLSGATEAQLPLITATTPGRGPKFFMDLDNWEGRVVPDSQDKIVIDDVNTAITYDIDLVQEFMVYAASGGFCQYRLASRKAIFVDNQKVRIQSSGTLLSGLTAGYFYVKSPTHDGRFFLSTDTTLGNRVTSTTAGTGTHKIGLLDVDLHVYARYPGGQIGLPFLRNGLKEYLPRDLNCWFRQMTIGDRFLGGNGLFLGRFDAEDSAVANGVEFITSQSSQDKYPAVCFRFNNAALIFNQRGGQGGLAVHDGETCVIDSINQSAVVADLTIANTTCDNPSDLFGTYRIFRSTVPGVMNSLIA